MSRKSSTSCVRSGATFAVAAICDVHLGIQERAHQLLEGTVAQPLRVVAQRVRVHEPTSR